jgi:hypothetical protein
MPESINNLRTSLHFDVCLFTISEDPKEDPIFDRKQHRTGVLEVFPWSLRHEILVKQLWNHRHALILGIFSMRNPLEKGNLNWEYARFFWGLLDRKSTIVIVPSHWVSSRPWPNQSRLGSNLVVALRTAKRTGRHAASDTIVIWWHAISSEDVTCRTAEASVSQKPPQSFWLGVN